MEECKTGSGDAVDAKQITIGEMEEITKPDEATVCFSVEELHSLEDRQRERNKNLEMKIHQRPNLVGYLYVKPETVPKVRRGEELCVSSNLYTHRRKRHLHSSGVSLSKEDGCLSSHQTAGEGQISHDLHSEAYRPPPRRRRKQGRYTSSSPEESMSSERVSPENTEDKPSNEEQIDLTETLESQSKVYTCSECGDCLNEQSLFCIHQRTHPEERNSIIKHDQSFISTRHQGVQTGEPVGTLLRHRRHNITFSTDTITEKRIQAEPKSYMCKECGKSFTQNASLIVHKRTHTGEKPHTCKVCLKSFISGSYLVMHQRVHTGERPYVCSDCGKRFISSSNLIIHQRVHTGEKPYLCTECGKCFGHSSHLVRHQKVHTGERPFTCAECGKSFSRSSHLVRHQTIHMRTPANRIL
ncbi:uncharacterized protein LOC142109019 isoform X2 [Mixophyes fleayi]|uniref:uncharacterized protein LOC142109019 isoform X2 n=1 Tax=Mixophyes fleayi TaxID=3061075 RepID=UPI003F4D9919